MDNLDRLFDEGVRMMGIAHFFDNELGGSNTGEEKHGLTPLGESKPRRRGHVSMASSFVRLTLGVAMACAQAVRW